MWVKVRAPNLEGRIVILPCCCSIPHKANSRAGNLNIVLNCTYGIFVRYDVLIEKLISSLVLLDRGSIYDELDCSAVGPAVF